MKKRTISSVVSYVLDFLKPLHILDQEDGFERVWEDLYIGREKEEPRLTSTINHILTRGRNVIVEGNAGIGKTTFANSVLNKLANIDNNHFIVRIEHKSYSTERLIILDLCNKLNVYFSKIQYENNRLFAGLTESSVLEKFQPIMDHFDKIDPNVKIKLILFLDDFDYAEEDKFLPFFKKIMDFISSKVCSVIICARPPLKVTIEEEPLYKQKSFAGGAVEFTLSSVTSSELFSSRRKFILEAILKADKNIHKKALRFLGRLGTEKRKEDNPTPLTNEYLAFILLYSNGNIREKLKMLTQAIMFVFMNSNKLEKDLIQSNKPIIGRDNIVNKLFNKAYLHGDDIPERALFNDIPFFINMYEHSNKKGKKTYYYYEEILREILVQKHVIITNDFYLRMKKKFGFDIESVASCIKRLEVEQLIYPKTISDTVPFSEISEKKKIKNSYTLSTRGDWYINHLSECEHYESLYK